MDVTILSLVTGGEGLGRVAQINEDQASLLGAVPGGGTDGNGVLEVVVDDNVVGTADGELLEETSKILDRVKGLGLLGGLDVQQLAHVEDLDVVVLGLGANDGVVVENTDLTPNLGFRAGGVGETTEIVETSVTGDFREGCTIGLVVIGVNINRAP